VGASNRKMHEIVRGLWSVSLAPESGRSKAAKTAVPRLWALRSGTPAILNERNGLITTVDIGRECSLG
jgi:hypothetical protein